MTIEQEAQEDRQIDPANLDLEATQQAELYHKWAIRYVKARMEVEKQEYNLDLVRARQQIRCREHPEQFELTTITEMAVKAAVERSQPVREANEKLLELREKSMYLEKTVQAIEQRKRMIEILVTLHGQEYFAGPSVPNDLVSTWRERHQQDDEEFGSVMKGKARKPKTKAKA